MAKVTLHICILLIFGEFCGGCNTRGNPPVAAVSSTPIIPLSPPIAQSVAIDAPANGFSYAYGPAIIYTQGEYHLYFCSTGNGGNDWDHIRHVTSSDLLHWSAEDTVLAPTAYERATCDPSVVWSEGFYYLFYGGNVTTDQTVIFVARSASPDGPFLKYTRRGTWERNPTDSKIVIAPIHPTTSASYYCAGHPTVVIRNRQFYMWYTDDTSFQPLDCHKYFTTSFDGTSWSPGILTTTQLRSCSMDVKYDLASAQFVMLEILNQFAAASLLLQLSTDGVNWSDPRTLAPAGKFPSGANNPGISGDDQGALLNGQAALVAYGAPYPGTVETWGQWDLWGSLFSSAFSFEASIPPAYSLASSKALAYEAGRDRLP